MAQALQCAFPALAATTGYARGCRCERCCEGTRAAQRRWRERRAEERRQAIKDKQRDWYSLNRDRVRAEHAATGRPPDADSMALALRRDIAPAMVRGPFSPAEDWVIIAWRGTDLMLAVALGRSYDSIIARKHRLRRDGRLWT